MEESRRVRPQGGILLLITAVMALAPTAAIQGLVLRVVAVVLLLCAKCHLAGRKTFIGSKALRKMLPVGTLRPDRRHLERLRCRWRAKRR